MYLKQFMLLSLLILAIVETCIHKKIEPFTFTHFNLRHPVFQNLPNMPSLNQNLSYVTEVGLGLGPGPRPSIIEC